MRSRLHNNLYWLWRGGILRYRSAVLFARGDWWMTRFGQWLCERRGHAGVRWFNAGACEPDMHCKRCDKDLA